MTDDLFFACRCGLPECEPCLANVEIERLRAENDRLRMLVDAVIREGDANGHTLKWRALLDALLAAAATKEDDRG